MDYLLFFLLLIVLFSVYTIGPSVVALIHTYFGGKQYREFRSQLYEVSNVTTAVPRFKMFTKKTFSVEFDSKGSKQVVRFQVRDPAQWKENITKWAIDAKRVHDEERRRTTEEDYRRKLEMARAKAGTTNVGVLHVNSPNEVRKKSPQQKNHRADVIDAEDVGTTALQKTESMPPAEIKYCPECGYSLDSNMKFCPSCGTKVS